MALRLSVLSGSSEETHESARGQVGDEKCRVAFACYASQGLRREVSAADRPFHRGGPTGRGPVPGKEDARPDRFADAADSDSTPGRGE